jgi:hypothetical protein
MTPNQIFSIANGVALIAWVLLALFPRRRAVRDVLVGTGVPVVLAVLYTAIIAVMFGSSEGGFSTLTDVATLFGNPWLLLAGWIHYLAFDLLIGRWEVRDAQQRGSAGFHTCSCCRAWC